MQAKKKKFSIPRLIGILLLLLLLAALCYPNLLSFLSPEQQSLVSDFQTNYFSKNDIAAGEMENFDWLRLAAVLLLFLEAWAVNAIVKLLLGAIHFKNRHTETIKHLIGNLITYAVVIYAIIFGLSILGVNIMAIIAGVGILGLVVGFGAQTLIEDVITGLFIILEGQFHVGDFITVDGFRGAVTAIGIRTTSITDVGGNTKIINNSDIRNVTNLSEVESLAIADVGISYNADLLQAEKAINELLQRLPEKHPKIFHTAPQYQGVQSLSASSVDLRIAAKVDEGSIYTARRILNRELKLCLDEAKIEIPFPQMVVHQAK